MALGHNPGWEAAVYGLCGVQVRMLPGCAALLRIESATWSDALARNDWQLDDVVRPDVGHHGL